MLSKLHCILKDLCTNEKWFLLSASWCISATTGNTNAYKCFINDLFCNNDNASILKTTVVMTIITFATLSKKCLK